MNRKQKLIMTLVALAILGTAFLAMRWMIASRPEPKKTARETPGAADDDPMIAPDHGQGFHQGTGTVQPRRQVEIAPQVAGRVAELSPRLVAGGFFRAGEVLLRIEEADFRLAVERSRAALAKAEYDLATVESQARIAREEWDRLGLEDGGEPNPLALYEPQLKNARAAVLAAEAVLAQARLDLARTELRAPFDGLVLSESVDSGQYLRVGNPVAVYVGSGQAEVVVPLPQQELVWLTVPRPGDSRKGSPATVRMEAGQRVHEWNGKIVRRLGDVDPQGRMTRVVVAVDDPYGLEDTGEEGGPDLAIGSFVEVALQGSLLKDVAVLPASVLRDGGTVWLMNDGHLRFRPVEVIRRSGGEVVLGEGLETGETVVLTNVVGAAEGMKLRPTRSQDQGRPVEGAALPEERP